MRIINFDMDDLNFASVNGVLISTRAIRLYNAMALNHISWGREGTERVDSISLWYIKSMRQSAWFDIDWAVSDVLFFLGQISNIPIDAKLWDSRWLKAQSSRYCSSNMPFHYERINLKPTIRLRIESILYWSHNRRQLDSRWHSPKLKFQLEISCSFAKCNRNS